MIRRYTLTRVDNTLEEHPDGQFVLYTDYESLQAENVQLQERINELKLLLETTKWSHADDE